MSAEVRHSELLVPRSPQKILTDRLSALWAKIECRRADTVEEREAIFRLRYQAYLREEAISANRSERFADADDDADNAYIFGLYIEGELASSLRIHVGSKKQDFPSLHVFPDVLQPLLDAGRVMIDSTRFVADEKRSRLHRGLPYATLRASVLAAEYFHADDLLAAVRVEHQAFYQRAFNHQVLCAARPYPQLAKPISLMSLHFPTAADWLYRHYPFFRSTALERRRLFERPASPGIQPNQDTGEASDASPERGNVTPFRERANRCLTG
jgi:N-acyl-L-homoserine lactone synthetase